MSSIKLVIICLVLWSSCPLLLIYEGQTQIYSTWKWTAMWACGMSKCLTEIHKRIMRIVSTQYVDYNRPFGHTQHINTITHNHTRTHTFILLFHVYIFLLIHVIHVYGISISFVQSNISYSVDVYWFSKHLLLPLARFVLFVVARRCDACHPLTSHCMSHVYIVV